MADLNKIPPIDCNAGPNLTFALDGAKPYIPPEICIGEVDYSVGECAESEANLIASYQAEMLQISGGPINVFAMLGVHNQGTTADLISSTGYPLSSGTPSGFNALDAFNVNDESWRSIQQGSAVLITPAFIGYNFGTKKAWEKIGTPQERYVKPEPVRKQVNSIRIKQGSDSTNRVTKLRVEVSDNGISWNNV